MEWEKYELARQLIFPQFHKGYMECRLVEKACDIVIQ
jgi:hypothetical protein